MGSYFLEMDLDGLEHCRLYMHAICVVYYMHVSVMLTLNRYRSAFLNSARLDKATLRYYDAAITDTIAYLPLT